jgi:prepilin-type N-terminal cleavage/methylation domain-containing protein/prepilin-type processing-associated H-X9-DG protein
MPQSRRHAFTLVELLVVIAIMAVLIAMLLPGLGRAKKVAKTSRCLANSRAMGQSLNIFMSDRQTNIKYTTFTPNNAWTAILKEYGNTDKLRACPEVTDPPTGTGTINAGSVTRPWYLPSGDTRYIAAGAYAINGWIQGGDYNTMLGYANGGVTNKATVAAFHKWPFVGIAQSQVPVFAEATWPDGWPRESNVAPGDLQSGAAPGQSVSANSNSHLDRFVIDRHSKAINVGFADNHAETVKLVELWSIRWTANWVPTNAPKLPQK